MEPAKAVSTIAAENDLVTLAFSRQDLERVRRQGPGGAIDQRIRSAGPDIGHDTDVVAVVSRPLVELFFASFESLVTEMALAPASVIVLVPWKEPPERDTRPDGVVDSFMCDVATFRAARALAGSQPPEHSCFTLLDGILNRRIANDRLVVRQLPSPRRPSPMRLDARAALIMAHRGDPRHLTSALQSIARGDDARQVKTRVGLDVDALDDYVDVRDQFPGVTFCSVDPAPAGLFVIRQHFLETANEEYFYLQDSDDASCSDRFTSQLDELRRTGADLVGCHELRIDETTGTVEALRLPLDANKALSRGYSESLLNGTVIGAREAVLRTGGYSTNRKIANDTQFMLRAYFQLRMRNVDGFFYLRRRHKASLTMAPETGLGTPVREGLRAKWKSDFEAVLRGELVLEYTSLRHMRSDVDYRIREWIAPARDMIAPAIRHTLQSGTAPCHDRSFASR